MRRDLSKFIEDELICLEDQIVPEFFFGVPVTEQRQEAAQISSLLADIIPEQFLQTNEELDYWLSSKAPHVVLRHHYPWRFRHSIRLLTPSIDNFNQECFVIDILKKQLIPGKEVEVCAFRSHRFHFKDFANRTYLLIEVTIRVEDKRNYETLLSSFPLFSQLLTVSLQSPLAAEYAYSAVLQTLSQTALPNHEQKIFEIQNNINRLLKKFPDVFDASFLQEWGCFIATNPSHFFDLRSPRHLSRLIAFQFIMKGIIKRNLVAAPDKRHLLFRFLPTKLLSPFGQKKVLGLLVCVSLYDKHEHFDEEHVLPAVRKWVPNAKIIQGSKSLYRNPQEERLCVLYLEIDKEDKEYFSKEELKVLKTFLSQELKERVQRLVPLLFTVRNEELIMKNLIVLSQELKSIHSFPHMMLSFEKQAESSLIFTLLIVYPSTYIGLEDKLYSVDPHIEISLDRKDCVGHLDDGTPKEGAVFRVQIAKTTDMLRSDFSVNVNFARKKIAAAFSQALGNIRDYDGGLITKQHELFSQFLAQFSLIASEQIDLLEDFFFNLNPIEKQATLSLSTIEKLFKLVLCSQSNNFSSKGAYFLENIYDTSCLICFLRAGNRSLKKFVSAHLAKAHFPQKILISNLFSIHDTYCHGFILETTDNAKQKIFLDSIHQAIEEWEQSLEDVQTLHLNLMDDLLSLDPRLGGDAVSKSILKMLFEGLTRMGPDGKARLASAEQVEISPDLKTYTFTLKKAFWSNGLPLKAADFEYAWKKILSPDFKTSFAYIFYTIKKAKEAKEGKVSIDEVGIYSINDSTLRVELTHPVPYLLELISHPLFSPIFCGIDKTDPYWATSELEPFVCNGPFRLKTNRHKENYILEKNPFYANEFIKINLNQIIITKTNARTALEMFKNDELDWLGAPMRLWEPYFESAKNDKTEEVLTDEKVFWCNLNVKRWPLTNKKLRQALALAINRKEIVEVLRDGAVALSPIPSNSSVHPDPFVSAAERKDEAKKLFNEALEELGVSFETFPQLHMLYPDYEKRYKTARLIADQWRKVLGIDVQLQGYTWPKLFRKLVAGDFELATITWSSWISDPIFTLNFFLSSPEDLNVNKWEYKKFKELVDLANYETNEERRNMFMSQAETILMEECPVIPIISEKNKGLKKKNVTDDFNQGLIELIIY